ncbi:putative integral membrane protein [Lachnospiraceae bacterium JC7]|nr:putative integral membrane protein [Lachnospiraceae bacterium JC7]
MGKNGESMKQKKIVKIEYIWMLLIGLSAILLRYMFRELISNDMKACLVPWYEELPRLSFRRALVTQVGNYYPLYQLMIYGLTRFPGDSVFKYKLLSCLFDFVLALGVYFFVKKYTDSGKAVTGYAVTLFLPTVWLNSAAWGQCDSIYVSLIVIALYLLFNEKTTGSVILLGLAMAFGSQTVFVLPFFLFVYIYGFIKKKTRLQLLHFVTIPVTMIWASCPNILAGRPITDLIAVYFSRTGKYGVISGNYPGVWKLMRLSYDSDKWWCIGFTLLILCGLMIWFYRNNVDIFGRHFLWCAFLLSYTCVLFLPGMNERYGYIYEILAVLLALCTGAGWYAVMITQLISMKTYFYFLYHTPLNMELLSIINVSLYVFMIYAFYREVSGKPMRSTLFAREKGIDPFHEEKLPETDMEGVRPNGDKRGIKAAGISSYDKKAMLILTVIFLVYGSMHLGQMKAPETAVEVGVETEEGHEVYVPFDSEKHVKTVCIYPLLSKDIKFDLFYADDGEWKKIEGEADHKGAFTWKQMDADVKTHQLCVIFKDPEAQIAEIVCLDSEGRQIPVSGEAKPAELFDEQDCLRNLPTAFESMIFDEIYHGRTAYEFLHGLKIYENTHPPLGKTIISIGVRLFGMNPFGYRIMSLLFGAICIPVVYLFGSRITGKTAYGMLAAVLQMTEFMHYTLSRIATIDIFVAFFVLVMFYGVTAFVQEEKEKYLILSGAAFSLGAATKWTAIYAASGVAVILFVWLLRKWRPAQTETSDNRTKNRTEKERKQGGGRIGGYKGIVRIVLICIGVYIILPSIVYVLSYIPFLKAYPEKNILQHAISNSIHMLSYHRGVNAPHPYESSWYTWLFDWIPLVDSRVYIGEYKGVIATFVNPFICYTGLAAVAHHVYLSYRRDKIAAILLVFYICMLLPWMFISRTVFIYQYFICTKVLIFMICYSIYKLRFINEEKVLCAVAGISGFLFIAYLPVLSGVLVKTAYINEILKVLPKWWF